VATAAPATVASPPREGGDRRRKKPTKLKKVSDLKRLGRRDKIVVGLFLGVPLVLVLVLVVFPAIATVILSFAKWDGIGGLDQIEWIGFDNYVNAATIYPPFWPAIQNNVVMLVFLFTVPTVLGMYLAVLLDRQLRGSWFYETSFFMPVVLSLALTGFIWQLIYSRDQGLINALTGGTTDWYGDPSVNFYAVLVAQGWRHTGYIMLIYLAGLKGVDVALREAALMDGCTERQTFFRVVFPVMKPINIIVLVITVIESLRAFDIVWVINKGRNGLELIAALVTQNVSGEASRIGFASALATIMLLVSTIFVIIYLRAVMRDEPGGAQ
jgi:multiple sugar transport system permease protein